MAVDTDRNHVGVFSGNVVRKACNKTEDVSDSMCVSDIQRIGYRRSRTADYHETHVGLFEFAYRVVDVDYAVQQSDNVPVLGV